MAIRKPFRLPGKPSWYIEVNRKRRSTGTADHREAMAIYRDLCRKAELSGDQAKTDGIETFVADYLAWSKSLHAEATQKQDRQSLGKMQRHVGVLNLQDIDQKAADRIVAGLIGEGMAKTSVNAHLRKIKAAFRKAVEWYGCPIVKIRLLKEEKAPPRVIPPASLKRFLMSISGRDRQLVEAYLSSGRRRCELLNLEWKDVDLEGRRYFVNQKKVHLSGWFPMGKAFHGLLSGMPRTDGKVFPGIAPNYATRIVKLALRRSGLDDLRLHDLRHTYAALYLEAGGNIFALKELLGHRQIQTTQIYAHLSKEKLQEEADRVTFA